MTEENVTPEVATEEVTPVEEAVDPLMIDPETGERFAEPTPEVEATPELEGTDEAVIREDAISKENPVVA